MKPLINRTVVLKKIAGKGGWTYAEIPEILPDAHAPFGWRRVKGSIDGFEFNGYHLMPMGNGQLFLPVKAQIRKTIDKKEGDSIHVILYEDPLPKEVPEELLNLLKDDFEASKRFSHLKLEERKKYSDWIYSAKNEEQKVIRIAELINRLLKT
ncbi:MAG: DUF1905 domain-containing protein [Saprospiraceae bacterium]|nr:DUF1905 domain-containing protein [Saprospiraceae bacterium]